MSNESFRFGRGKQLSPPELNDRPRIDNHVMCDHCWIKKNGYAAIPHRIKPPELERCCFCALATMSGIYVRASTNEVVCDSCWHFHEKQK